MVALIVGLKWQLLRNGLRRSTPQLVGLILGGLYGLSVLVVVATGLITLRFAVPSDAARTVVIIGGSALTLGWAVFPVIAYGIDETLDPARFATFAVPRRQLVLGLLVSSLVSVPAAVTTILGLATVITWSRSVLAVLVAPVAAAVAVLTCVALSRVTSTAFSSMSQRRRGREAVPVLVLLLSVGLGVVGSYWDGRPWVWPGPPLPTSSTARPGRGSCVSSWRSSSWRRPCWRGTCCCAAPWRTLGEPPASEQSPGMPDWGGSPGCRLHRPEPWPPARSPPGAGIPATSARLR